MQNYKYHPNEECVPWISKKKWGLPATPWQPLIHLVMDIDLKRKTLTHTHTLAHQYVTNSIAKIKMYSVLTTI